jgi:hypothetical protein
VNVIFPVVDPVVLWLRDTRKLTRTVDPARGAGLIFGPVIRGCGAAAMVVVVVVVAVVVVISGLVGGGTFVLLKFPEVRGIRGKIVGETSQSEVCEVTGGGSNPVPIRSPLGPLSWITTTRPGPGPAGRFVSVTTLPTRMSPPVFTTQSTFAVVLYVVAPLEYVYWMVPVAVTPSPVFVAFTVITAGLDARLNVPEPNAPVAPSPNADTLTIPPPAAATTIPSNIRNLCISTSAPRRSLRQARPRVSVGI